MSRTYHDDEWKHCEEEPPAVPVRTRAQEQAFIDQAYGCGRISREEWSKRFDELSRIDEWDAGGRVSL